MAGIGAFFGALWRAIPWRRVGVAAGKAGAGVVLDRVRDGRRHDDERTGPVDSPCAYCSLEGCICSHRWGNACRCGASQRSAPPA